MKGYRIIIYMISEAELVSGFTYRPSLQSAANSAKLVGEKFRERELMWAWRGFERKASVDRELEEERKKRMIFEEKASDVKAD